MSDPNDSPANKLAGITITGLPAGSQGTLMVGGSAAAVGQFVDNATIAGGGLQFVPNGTFVGPTAFAFRVKDDGGTPGVDTASGTNTFVLNYVFGTFANQAPSGADKTIGTVADQTYTLTTNDFGFSDPDGNTLQAVLISSLALGTGTLTDSGVAVTSASFVPVDHIAAGKVVFTAPATAGSSVTFGFQVQDNGGTTGGGVNLDQSANTITFTVAGRSHAPVLNAGLSCRPTKDQAYVSRSTTSPSPTATTAADALANVFVDDAAGSRHGHPNAERRAGGAGTADHGQRHHHRSVHVPGSEGRRAGRTRWRTSRSRCRTAAA